MLIRICMYIYIYTCIFIFIPMCMYIYIYTYTCNHMYIHMIILYVFSATEPSTKLYGEQSSSWGGCLTCHPDYDFSFFGFSKHGKIKQQLKSCSKPVKRLRSAPTCETSVIISVAHPILEAKEFAHCNGHFSLGAAIFFRFSGFKLWSIRPPGTGTMGPMSMTLGRKSCDFFGLKCQIRPNS